MKLMNGLVDVRKAAGNCIRCNVCTYSEWPENYPLCPMYSHEKCFTYSGGGLMYIAKSLIDNKLNFDSKVADLLYTCPGCLACDDICEIIPYSEPYISHSDIVRLMRREAVRRGLISPMKLKEIQAQIKSYEKAVSSININHNILGIPKSIYNNNAQRLLFLEWSFLRSQKKVYKSVLSLLEKIGEPIGGISDSGLSIPELYDLGFWDELKKYLNTKFDFPRLKGKQLIFVNPHFQEFFESKLAKFIPGYENTRSWHISEVLLESFKRGKLRSKRASKKIIVSFHDPCYLGRGLKIYDPPRSLLSLIDGVELKEMDRNRRNSFCCGARAGNNYFLDFSRKTAMKRLKEFKETGADFLITACPYCKVIFQKTLNKGEKNRVKDLTEFVEEHIE